MPIRLVCVSKGGGAAFDAAVAEYTSRLRRYTAFEEVTLKPNPRGAAAGDAAAQMAAEGERVVRAVGPRDRLVRHTHKRAASQCVHARAGADAAVRK